MQDNKCLYYLINSNWILILLAAENILMDVVNHCIYLWGVEQSDLTCVIIRYWLPNQLQPHKNTRSRQLIYLMCNGDCGVPEEGIICLTGQLLSSYELLPWKCNLSTVSVFEFELEKSVFFFKTFQFLNVYN